MRRKSFFLWRLCHASRSGERLNRGWRFTGREENDGFLASPIGHVCHVSARACCVTLYYYPCHSFAKLALYVIEDTHICKVKRYIKDRNLPKVIYTFTFVSLDTYVNPCVKVCKVSPTGSLSRRPCGDSLRRIVADICTLSPFHTFASGQYAARHCWSRCLRDCRCQLSRAIALPHVRTWRDCRNRTVIVYIACSIIYIPFPSLYPFLFDSNSELESHSRHERIVKVRVAHEIVITEMTKTHRDFPYASHSLETKSF